MIIIIILKMSCCGGGAKKDPANGKPAGLNVKGAHPKEEQFRQAYKGS
jgi:hypothetical protein